MDKFWMVWNPAGSMPVYQHTMENAAKEEARRLSAANQGQVFVVLEAIGSYAFPVPGPVWTEASDIPF